MYSLLSLMLSGLYPISLRVLTPDGLSPGHSSTADYEPPWNDYHSFWYYGHEMPSSISNKNACDLWPCRMHRWSYTALEYYSHHTTGLQYQGMWKPETERMRMLSHWLHIEEVYTAYSVGVLEWQPELLDAHWCYLSLMWPQADV